MKKSRLLGLYGVMALMGYDERAWGPRPTVKPQGRPVKKCGLEGCDEPANVGGYCCAEHCREARVQDRKKRGYL